MLKLAGLFRHVAEPGNRLKPESPRRKRECVESIQHFANEIIRVRQHRRVDVVTFFEITKTPAVLRDCVEWRMRLVNPQIDVERFYLR